MWGAKIEHLKAELLKWHENINQPLITRLLLGVRLNNQVIKFNGGLNELLLTLRTVPNLWNLRVARKLRQRPISSSIIQNHQRILFFRN